MLFLFGTVLLSLVVAGTSIHNQRSDNPVAYCNATKGSDERVYSCNYQWATADGDEPKCPETASNGEFVYKCPIEEDDDMHCDESYFIPAQRRELYCDEEQQDRSDLADCSVTQQSGVFVYGCHWDPYNN